MARTKGSKSAPAFDFNSLTPDVVDSLPKQNRTSKTVDTPFPGWLRSTYEAGNAMTVTVPEEQSKRTQSLIRQAAVQEGLGARVRPSDNGDGTVTITFAGAQKQNRQRKNK